jgi:hypothetical protein
VNKANKSANFAAGGIINCRTHKTHSLQTQEQTLGDQLCDALQSNESCDATSHARALPFSYISCLI